MENLIIDSMKKRTSDASVARLGPDNKKVCSGRDLALVLGKTQLPEDEARAWRRDLQAARKTLKAPGDKWR